MARTECHLPPSTARDQPSFPPWPVRVPERDVHLIGTPDLLSDEGPPSPAQRDLSSPSSSRALWLETPVERGRTPVSTSSHQRSTSVPSKPLKSALSVLDSSPTSPNDGRRKKKKVDFFDQAVLRRSETAPVLGAEAVALKGERGKKGALGSDDRCEARKEAEDARSNPDPVLSGDAGLESDGEESFGLPPPSNVKHGFALMSVYTVNREGSPVDQWTGRTGDQDASMPRSTAIEETDPTSLMVGQPSLDPFRPVEDDLGGTEAGDFEEPLQPPQGHEGEVLDTYRRMHDMEKRRFSVEEREELKVWSPSPEELGPDEIESDDAGSEECPGSPADDSIVSSVCTSGRAAMEAEDDVKETEQPGASPLPSPLTPMHAVRPSNQSGQRSISEPEALVISSKKPWELLRQPSSTSDFGQSRSKLQLPSHTLKADLAHCALTTISVRIAESAKPRLLEPKPCRTALTVCSSGSMDWMLWEEPTNAIDGVPVIEEESDRLAAASEDDGLQVNVSRASLSLDQIRTRLAAWSWAREHDRDDEYPHWIPLLAVDRSASSEITEGTLAPPNTERGSLACSTLHSNLHSPVLGEEDDGEEDDDPPSLEVKYKYKVTLSGPQPVDYVSLPKAAPHSLPISPLGTPYQDPLHHHHHLDDDHFLLHRDSVELSRQQLNGEAEAKMNPNLMTTSDSFLLTRSRYAGDHQSHLKSGLTLGSSGGTAAWHRMGGLPTIPEANMKGLEGRRRASSAGPRKRAGLWHPDEHSDCAIYEIERPRWFEGRHRSRLLCR